MSKRRSKRPSPGSQLGKPSGSSNPFNMRPIIDPPPRGIIRDRRIRLGPEETSVDPVMQMPGMMGQPPRGRGYIPLSGGPKVKKGDRVGPPDDLIKKANPTTTQKPRNEGTGQKLSGKKIRGDYSNPLDIVRPSDFLTPVISPPRKFPQPTQPYGPEDRRFGPYDTRKPPKRVMKRVPDVPPVPLPPKEEPKFEPPHSPIDSDTVGVYYYDNGRFLTRGLYNGKTSRTAQRRG